MSKIRKIIYLLSLAVVVAAVAAGGAGWMRYQRDLSRDAAVELLGKPLVSPSTVRIGTALTLSVDYRCPWHRRPVEVVFALPKGLAQAGPATIKRVKTGFGYSVWRVVADVKPFRTGELKGGAVQTVFNRRGEHNRITELKTALPDIRVEEFDPADAAKLALAGSLATAVSAQSRAWFWSIAAAALVLLLLMAVWLARRRRRVKNPPLPPWRAALLELALLRDMLKTGHADGQTCFWKLTDIVRNYLEKRFQLKAPHQTTEEFMRDLNRNGSPLQDHQRHFLGDFMSAADLVKFANMPADESLLGQAIDRAETLVNETGQPPEEDKK